MSELPYLTGFGSAHHSEALSGALPRRQNSPRKVPYGLHAEQINGTPFTVPRDRNQRVWLYRIRPSITHGELSRVEPSRFAPEYLGQPADPNLIGWRPRPADSDGRDFLAGLETIAGAGDPAAGPGLAVSTFACSADMVDRSLRSSDGELVILPSDGVLLIQTEHGWLRAGPGEVAVIPTAVSFRVTLPSGQARGVVFEAYRRHFHLPERGPIGANGLADERHFRYPVASYEDREVDGGFEVVVKHGGALWSGRRSHSPFDVVAWHGNYAPYVYDLTLFNAMGTVTWDHPDPSIFSVLSAPLDHPGENLADLVVFPNPRWDVAAHTFRPPFFHRQAATEINSIVRGPIDPDAVFTCGGIFVTPPYAAHGVSPGAIDRAYDMTDDEADAPRWLEGEHLWIQVESVLPLRYPEHALASPLRKTSFREFASGVRSRFDPDASTMDDNAG